MTNPRTRCLVSRIPLPDDGEHEEWTCTVRESIFDRAVVPLLVDVDLYCRDCMIGYFVAALKNPVSPPTIVMVYLDYRDFEEELESANLFEACAEMYRVYLVVPIRTRVHCTRNTSSADMAGIDPSPSPSPSRARPLSTKKTITCVKGGRTIKVTGKDPKCPTGYTIKK